MAVNRNNSLLHLVVEPYGYIGEGLLTQIQREPINPVQVPQIFLPLATLIVSGMVTMKENFVESRPLYAIRRLGCTLAKGVILVIYDTCQFHL
jgi:hypothetical protein